VFEERRDVGRGKGEHERGQMEGREREDSRAGRMGGWEERGTER